MSYRYKLIYLLCWNKANSYRKNIEMRQVQNWVFFLEDFYRHYKIFCVNRNMGFRKESRIFYFIHLQNEEDYERKESSSA